MALRSKRGVHDKRRIRASPPTKDESGLPEACGSGVHAQASGARRLGPESWTRADLDRLITGDKKTWDRALALVNGTVRKARLATWEAETVQDHTVDVLLADDFRRLRQVRDPARFAAYLSAVAKNRAIYVDKHRVKTLPLSEVAAGAVALVDIRPPPEFSPLAGAPEADRIILARALLRFRNALKKQQFRVLWLYHVEGVSMGGIAKAMQISREAVRQAHKRGLSAIRTARHGAQRPIRLK